ncbi:hypothetical protein KA005_63705, partial [bacterium]|nr:hypothetical protein [bacterium]
NVFNEIMLKRNEFSKAWGRHPDICIVPSNIFIEVFSNIPCRNNGDLFLGMKIEVGGELRCKFETELIIN